METDNSIVILKHIANILQTELLSYKCTRHIYSTFKNPILSLLVQWLSHQH